MPEQEISREDLELIDKIIDVIDINKEGTVDIPKLKNDCPNCCEGGRLDDVKAILNEMTNDIDWNDFVDALKLGLIHKAQGENSMFIREQVEISKDEEEKTKIQNDLAILTKRLSQLNDKLAREVASRNEYDKTIQETEAAYLKILESSQTLLTVLKRESVNMTKKRQASS